MFVATYEYGGLLDHVDFFSTKEEAIDEIHRIVELNKGFDLEEDRLMVWERGTDGKKGEIVFSYESDVYLA